MPAKKMVNEYPLVLNRFTSIDKLFSLLSSNQLVMSDPKYWEDKNDSELLNAYKKKADIKSLFALCFTDESETIYHWGAFSEKVNACCIEFDPPALLESIKADANLRHKKVKYIKINELEKHLTQVNDIPFCKRFPYRNESEYRIIFESDKPFDKKIIAVAPGMIRKITINQHLAKDVFELINKKIESEYDIEVSRSTVINNDRWINYVKRMEGN